VSSGKGRGFNTNGGDGRKRKDNSTKEKKKERSPTILRYGGRVNLYYLPTKKEEKKKKRLSHQIGSWDAFTNTHFSGT